MKYLKNNAKPQIIVIKQQKRLEYFEKAKNGKFVRYLIWIAMHPLGTRSYSGLDKEDLVDQYVLKYNLPQNEKLIINHKSDGFVKDYRYTSEQRRPINYSFSVEHYPHIVDFKIGNDKTDEVRYDLLVDTITPVESDEDAETLMKCFPFIDEVNEKGETIRENPYNKFDQKPMDTQGIKLPTQYENVSRESFVQKNKIPEAPKMVYREENVGEENK